MIKYDKNGIFSMQKILLIINYILISLIVSLISNFQYMESYSVLDDDSPYIVYENSEYGFSIAYPSSWNVTENFNSKYDKVLFELFIKSPFEGKGDLISEEFLLGINKMPENITFNAFVESALSQFTNTYKNFTLISNDTIQIDNHDARKISYTYIAGEGPLSIKLLMIHNIIYDNDKIYVLTYGTQPNKYYEDIEMIQKIYDSFKFLS